jgi:phage terminase small subunit
LALTARQELFVQEYLVDLNATQAAIRAGYSERTAYSQGQRLLKHVEVQAAVQAAMAARAERTEISADSGAGRALGDRHGRPGRADRVPARRLPLLLWRGHRYQETPAERERRRRDWESALGKAKEDGRAEAFDELGGLGFDPRRDPHPDCPECFGQGEGEAFVKDTRQLSPAGRRLYAGVKLTKDGLEVRMHDKGSALVNVGRHLGCSSTSSSTRASRGRPDRVITRVERVIVRPEDPDR